MEKIITIEIDKDKDGFKIEHILKNYIGASKKLICRLKRSENGILLNGTHAKTPQCVKCGDILSVTIPQTLSLGIIPEDIPLDVLYEDDDVIVINKPRSMPTHPSRRHPSNTLANALMCHFGGELTGFHAITRLDKDTSGVVLVAKNQFSANALSADMRNKRIEKEYIAVVNGIPEPSEGEISKPIKRAVEGEMLRIIAEDGKSAVTKYSVIASKDNLSLVRLIPVTGRTHQLRVHMKSIGTPIYGDYLYGAPQKGERQLLHCESIKFYQPITKKVIMVKAPMPNDIKSIGVNLNG